MTPAIVIAVAVLGGFCFGVIAALILLGSDDR